MSRWRYKLGEMAGKQVETISSNGMNRKNGKGIKINWNMIWNETGGSSWGSEKKDFRSSWLLRKGVTVRTRKEWGIRKGDGKSGWGRKGKKNNWKCRTRSNKEDGRTEWIKGKVSVVCGGTERGKEGGEKGWKQVAWRLNVWGTEAKGKKEDLGRNK